MMLLSLTWYVITNKIYIYIYNKIDAHRDTQACVMVNIDVCIMTYNKWLINRRYVPRYYHLRIAVIYRVFHNNRYYMVRVNKTKQI